MLGVMCLGLSEVVVLVGVYDWWWLLWVCLVLRVMVLVCGMWCWV